MEWVEQMTTRPGSFLIEDFRIEELQEDIKWARSRWALNKEVPTGKRLTFVLKGEKETEGVTVELHYDLYDHIPVIRKSMEVTNNTPQSINIDAFQLEYLAFAEPESPGGGDPSKFRLPNIHIKRLCLWRRVFRAGNRYHGEMGSRSGIYLPTQLSFAHALHIRRIA